MAEKKKEVGFESSGQGRRGKVDLSRVSASSECAGGSSVVSSDAKPLVCKQIPVTTTIYPKYDLDEAIEIFVRLRTPMRYPVNVKLPRSRLFITLKSPYEIVALDLLLCEHSARNFVRPIKFPYPYDLISPRRNRSSSDSSSRSGAQSVKKRNYIPDFMILEESTIAERFRLIEVIDYDLDPYDEAYRRKLGYVQEEIRRKNAQFGEMKYIFEIWDKPTVLSKIDLYQKPQHLALYSFKESGAYEPLSPTSY